ncbi:hypothetical protein AVEN_254337-1 [Araneus ventricosus]|uniref:Uncharacterized protein n=1 Tax=Araneus ventricosus TaxID=182803 RepID=A0A4Y2M7S1_ARAVE|nr:hypothetical protein AVEN_254337-1 [Araneus ventricosus]
MQSGRGFKRRRHPFPRLPPARYLGGPANFLVGSRWVPFRTSHYQGRELGRTRYAATSTWLYHKERPRWRPSVRAGGIRVLNPILLKICSACGSGAR